MDNVIKEHESLLRTYEQIGWVDMYIKERRKLEEIYCRNGIVRKQEYKQQTLF